MRFALLALLLMPSAAGGQNLLVSSRFTDQVLRYGPTGLSLGAFASGGGLDNPVGLTFGPDGHLYVASGNTAQVLRYDGATGAALGVFASGGGLSGPRNLNFGPDGHLYVASGATSQILRFDGVSGAFLGVFAQDPNLSGPTSLTFGPDRNLYAGGVLSNRIVRFHGTTGAFIGVFASSGLSGPHDLAFGPDGRLYVSNAFGTTNDVVRLDGATGALLGTFIDDPALQFPLGLMWTDDGHLLVANQGGDEIRRYDGVLGSLLGIHVAPGAGGLDGPLFLAYERTGTGPLLTPPAPGTGFEAIILTTGLQAGAFTGTVVGVQPGALPLPFCPGQALGLLDPYILALGVADESGRFLFRQFVPNGAGGIPLILQAVDVTACAVTAPLVHVP